MRATMDGLIQTQMETVIKQYTANEHHVFFPGQNEQTYWFGLSVQGLGGKDFLLQDGRINLRVSAIRDVHQVGHTGTMSKPSHSLLPDKRTPSLLFPTFVH